MDTRRPEAVGAGGRSHGHPAGRISSLHVGKYFPPFSGGMENFLADLVGALTRRGVRSSVVVHDHVPWSRGETKSMPTPGAERDGCRAVEASFRLYRVPAMGRLLYAPVSPRFPFWLARAVSHERPDLLHLHLPNTSAFWALCAPSARRIPWIVHWHADVVSSEVDRRLKLAYPAYALLERKLLERASKVLVTSPNYLAGSRALRPWREKCVAVPLGLDASRIPQITERSRETVTRYWGDVGFRILSVGRLTYYKGHEYLVKALRDVPGARALIVGEGDQRGAIENEITLFGVEGKVTLTGELPHETLHALMASCDCVCLPSIERTEAFGMVLIEAMAHGKPAVVCDIPGSGVSWVVRDGETGRVVPASNPDALAGALRSLARDRAGLARLGRAGYRRYQSQFLIDRVVDDVLRIYWEVLSP